MRRPTILLLAGLLAALHPFAAGADPCCTLDYADSQAVEGSNPAFGPDGDLYLQYQLPAAGGGFDTWIGRWTRDAATGALTGPIAPFNTESNDTYSVVQVFDDYAYLGGGDIVDRDPATGQLSNMRSNGAFIGLGPILSPDGVHAYGGLGTTLQIFSRGSDGILTEDTVVGPVDIAPPLAALEATGDAYMSRMVMGPDGDFLYILAGHSVDDRFNNDNPNLTSIMVYERDPGTGGLTYVDHYETVDDQLSDAALIPRGLLVHPSGDFLVALIEWDGIHVWERDPATGELSATDFLDGYNREATTFAPTGSHVVLQDSNELLVFEFDTGSGELSLAEVQEPGVSSLPALPNGGDAIFSPDALDYYLFKESVLRFEYFEQLEEIETLSFVQQATPAGASTGDRDTPTGLAESADGLFLYASMAEDDDVVVFGRNPGSGALTELGRVGSKVGGSLLDPGSLALSPDGNHLYALGSDGISRLDIAGDGSLTYVETTATSNGHRMVMSGDGAELFVISLADNTLQVFERTAATGALTPAELFEHNVGGVDKLNNPTDVVLSPDGAFVYTINEFNVSVSRFARNAGTVTYDDAQEFYGRQLAIPSGGQHLYLLGNFDLTVPEYIEAFDRDGGTGSLTQIDFMKGGIARLEGLTNDSPSLRGVGDAAFAPSGNYLYATGENRDSLVSLRRDASTGRLRFVQAVYDGEGGVTGLEAPQTVLPSADGLHVHVSAPGSGSVIVFERVAGASVLVNGFALPKKIKVTKPGDLVWNGFFDLGTDPVDLSAPLTLTAGDMEIVLPGLVPNKAGTSWSYKDDVVNLKLGGPKSSSSRAKLKLKVIGDFIAYADGAVALEVGLSGGGLDAHGTAVLSDRSFKLGKDALVEPVLAPEKLRAKAPVPSKARVKAKLRVAEVPEPPFDVTISFGDAYTEMIPADAFVEKGSRLEYKSKEGPVTLVRIDRVTGQTAVDARGAELDAFAQAQDASLSLALGGESARVHFGLGGGPGARKY